MQQTKEGRSWD